MKRILFIFFALLLIGFYSCKTDKTNTSTKKGRVIAKKTDAKVKADMDNLLHDMHSTSNEPNASDDHKIDNLQTLLARVRRHKNYDQQALTQEIAARDNQKVKRYDRQVIASVAAVDSYDSNQI